MKIRNLLKFVAFVAILLVVEKYCKKATDGFDLEWIKYPVKEAVEPVPIDPKIGRVLEQPFHYLGRGGQCFAFLSEDGLYVLKVFKQHHLRLPSFIHAIAPSFITEQFERKEKQFMTSCLIASTEFAEGTGVVLGHLENQPGLPSHIILLDPLHIMHKVQTTRLPFILQKKATLVDAHLKQLMQQGKIEEAKQAIDRLIALVRLRCEKGIADNDPVINRNFGFIGEQAVEIDIGSYSYEPRLKLPDYHRRELYFELHHFHDHLYGPYPELALYVENQLKALLSSNDGRE